LFLNIFSFLPTVTAGVCKHAEEYKYSSVLLYKFGKDNWWFPTQYEIDTKWVVLRRCWCSMLSLYNHKPLHQQPDTVNPVMSQKSPAINSEWEKQRLIAPLLNSVVGVIFHSRKNLLVEHQQRRKKLR